MDTTFNDTMYTMTSSRALRTQGAVIHHSNESNMWQQLSLLQYYQITHNSEHCCVVNKGMPGKYCEGCWRGEIYETRSLPQHYQITHNTETCCVVNKGILGKHCEGCWRGEMCETRQQTGYSVSSRIKACQHDVDTFDSKAYQKNVDPFDFACMQSEIQSIHMRVSETKVLFQPNGNAPDMQSKTLPVTHSPHHEVAPGMARNVGGAPNANVSLPLQQDIRPPQQPHINLLQQPRSNLPQSQRKVRTLHIEKIRGRPCLVRKTKAIL